MKRCHECKAPLGARHDDHCGNGTVRLADCLPRLTRSLQRCALLSYTEANGCLEAKARGDQWAGEAVNHYGGVNLLMRMAWRLRPSMMEIR